MDEQTTLSPFLPGFKEHAYPFYQRLRDEEPVARTILPDGQVMWLIARYDDALNVLRDHQRFGNDPLNVLSPEEYERVMRDFTQGLSEGERERFAEIDEFLGHNLLGVDPPDHSRLRRLVSQSFTPRFIEGLRPRVQQIAGGLIDAIEADAAASGRHEVDLIDAFAFPLPITVISEMLGVPDEDRERFRLWSNAVVMINPTQVGDEARLRSLSEFIAYLRRFVGEKRTNPGDDLVSGLVLAESKGTSSRRAS